MFKEIKAVFKTKSDLLRESRNFKFEVERVQSGAFGYGDKSAHTMRIYADDEFINDKYYDTRYDGISTNKEEWIKLWKEFIQDKWGLQVECISFELKEVQS